MEWEKSESSFIYNGKPVVRKKAVSSNPIGWYKVYESVGGNPIVQTSFVDHSDLNEGAPGYDNGMSEWFGQPKLRCSSFERGLEICESHWQQVKDKVNKY